MSFFARFLCPFMECMSRSLSISLSTYHIWIAFWDSPSTWYVWWRLDTFWVPSTSHRRVVCRFPQTSFSTWRIMARLVSKITIDLAMDEAQSLPWNYCCIARFPLHVRLGCSCGTTLIPEGRDTLMFLHKTWHIERPKFLTMFWHMNESVLQQRSTWPPMSNPTPHTTRCVHDAK